MRIDKEYILCAAIHYDDGKEYVHQPRNIISGIVACGWRHHNCFTILFELEKSDDKFTKANVTQGFLTSKGKFVTRKEGAKIAFKAEQIKKKQNTMFSEDLY
jgi:hypothetical protein